jgi:hypothetical protein
MRACGLLARFPSVRRSDGARRTFPLGSEGGPGDLAERLTAVVVRTHAAACSRRRCFRGARSSWAGPFHPDGRRGGAGSGGRDGGGNPRTTRFELAFDGRGLVVAGRRLGDGLIPVGGRGRRIGHGRDPRRFGRRFGRRRLDSGLVHRLGGHRRRIGGDDGVRGCGFLDGLRHLGSRRLACDGGRICGGRRARYGLRGRSRGIVRRRRVIRRSLGGLGGRLVGRGGGSLDGAERRRRRRRLELGANRQERQGIDVPLRIGGRTDAEVHVRTRNLRDPAGPEGAELGALGDRLALVDARRTEVQERHRPAVRGADRDVQAVRWDASDERHHTGCRRDHALAGPSGDVDAAMLARAVRVGPEGKRPSDGASDRPAPAGGRHRSGKREQ